MRTTSMTILKRGSIFQLRRRVPWRYAAIEPRSTVWTSLHTDSQEIAENKANRAWAQMIEGWEARLAGDSADAEARFAAAQALTAVRGFRYLDVDQVKRLPVGELVERVEAIDAPSGAPNQVEATALLGVVQEPGITLEKALELYWGLTKDKTSRLRTWKVTNSHPTIRPGRGIPAYSDRLDCSQPPMPPHRTTVAS